MCSQKKIQITNCYISPQSLDLPSCGSEATNSSHPETPDSCSVKEEPESGLASAPAQTSWRCLWADCDAPEFLSQRALVDHVNESHMEVKKGYDELPCLWKVRSDGRTLGSCLDLVSLQSLNPFDRFAPRETNVC